MNQKRSYDAKDVVVSETGSIDICPHFPRFPVMSINRWISASKLRVHQHCTGVPHFFLFFHPDDDALPLWLPLLVQQLPGKVPDLPPSGIVGCVVGEFMGIASFF